ncbi:hypothetical protein GYH30_042901 [Glycine max]|nr:hypothetical protein GYH30_042901 [Glycine max]
MTVGRFQLLSPTRFPWTTEAVAWTAAVRERGKERRVKRARVLRNKTVVSQDGDCEGED